MELLFLQRVKQSVVIELDHLGRLFATVNDAGGLPGTTQAAARTSALQTTFECDDFHVDS